MAELRFPADGLEDVVVRLRPWRETDVASQLEAFSHPWFQRFSDGAPRALRLHPRGPLRSHMPFKDGRRDTSMFSLLPGELRP